VGPEAAAMSEDEFFRQLVAGELADGPTDDARRADPACRPGGNGRPPTAPQAAATARRAPRTPSRAGRAAAEQDSRRARHALMGAVVALAAAALVCWALPAVSPKRPESAAGERPARTKLPGRPAAPTARPPARLGVWWPRGGESERTIRLRVRWRRGAEAVIAGRVTTRQGAPVAGARVSVLAGDADRPRDGSRLIGELRTDRDGRLRGAVSVDGGPARKLLTFTHVPNGRDAAAAVTARALLEVSATVTARAVSSAARRGGTVRLGGDSAPPAREVEVLVREPRAQGWIRRLLVPTGASGRWEAGFYLPGFARPGVYRFRARVRGDRARGVLGVGSGTLAVRVR
jgi:hypothetical protein